MRKTNRIMMGTVSILLCLVLVTTSVLSGIFAKFVTKRKAEANVAFKKWGITVTPGSDLEDSYSTVIDGEDRVVVKSKLDGKLMAPGTRGALAYLRVKSEPNDPPEVRYELNFDGEIDIGFGFWSTKSLVEEKEYVKEKLRKKYPTLSPAEIDTEYDELLKIKSKVAFFDESGAETGYLPIQLKLRRIDLNADESVNSNVMSHKLCLVRLDPNAPKDATVYSANDGEGNDYTQYRWCFYGGSSYGDIAMLEEDINEGKYYADGEELNYWNYYFDENRVRLDMKNLAINSIYAVEWDWLYHYDTVEEAEANSGNSNRYTHTPTDGSPNESAVGDYQTAELDTQLGEAIARVLRDYPEYSDMFNISLDMSVSVEQIANTPAYTRNGDRITFGSYPQSEVTDATLKATLDGLTSNIEKWNYYQPDYGMQAKNAIEYVDVKNENDKYRGVKVGGGTEIFWFKYEPIVWIVLEEKDGKAFLVSEKLLDQRKYQDDFSGDYNTSEGVPANTWASSWEYSTIRKWLNETFYKTAFDKLQRLIVLTTEVDNSASTTKFKNNEYASTVKTQDKVFLLSYQEVIGEDEKYNQYGSTLKTIFLNDNDDNTAYSRKINDQKQWRTRSPETETQISTIGGYRPANRNWNQGGYQCNACFGVRPALWIEL